MKKKIFNWFKRLLLYMWELPQNILGIILEGIICFYSKYRMESLDIIFIVNNVVPFNLSLGKYVFLSDVNNTEYAVGHAIQSKILGPLYLFIVLIPLFIYKVYSKMFKDNDINKCYLRKHALNLYSLFMKENKK